MIDADLDFDAEFEEESEDCPYSHLFLSFLTMPKPFGFMFDDEAIEKFLKKRGYKIITKTNSDEEEIKIAVKLNDSCIPDIDSSNIRTVFYDDVQEILLNWLLKIGSEK